jgi:hypothetical protein
MDDEVMMRCMMIVMQPPFKHADGSYYIPNPEKILDPYGEHPDRVFTDVTEAAQALWSYALMRQTILDVFEVTGKELPGETT